MRAVRLTTAQLDRACGAVLGSAVGDALGAGYEFGSATVGSGGPAMIGGGLGGFAPGEWTDDTSMAVAILEVAASGVDLRDESSLDRIASGFRAWFDTHPPDIGVQTRRVLADAGPEPTAAKLTAAAYDLHVRMGRTAGNGGLMRTSPVALAHLDDDAATAEAARRIGELTHFDPRSGEACTLWSLAIRHAILHAEFDIRSGLAQLDVESAAYWTERLDEAEVGPASRFTNNEWVVEALQAAWSAIVHTPVPHRAGDGDAGMPCAHLPAALSTAIGIGHDTDTVAAIAGALLGARWGASAVPAHWRRMLHGYPGINGERLVELATLAARGESRSATGGR